MRGQACLPSSPRAPDFPNTYARLGILTPSRKIVGYVTISDTRGTFPMEESPNNPLSPSDSKKWIVRIVLALVLGQAIWGLVVSLTTGLLVPLTARVMGNDPASALYLGKGDIDIPALFISILEFCMAGIV